MSTQSDNGVGDASGGRLKDSLAIGQTSQGVCLDQIELGIRSLPSDERVEREQELAEQPSQSIVPTFDAMPERLEAVSRNIDQGHPGCAGVHCSDEAAI